MDTRFIEDSNNNRNEENLASLSSKSQHLSRSIELGGTDDRQESAKCNHFSIRGYVSEIRKTNREICWPFHVIDSHYNLEEQAKLLPPIAVTEFRWWGCKSCLQKSHNVEVAIKSGADMNSHNLENGRHKTDGTTCIGNPVVKSHAHAPSSLSDFQLAPRETIFGESSVDANGFTSLKDGHFHSPVSYHEKDKESINAGLHKPEVHSSLLEGNQNPLSETPARGGMNCKGLSKQETDSTEMKAAHVSETHKTKCIISDCGAENSPGSTANISQRVFHSEKTELQGENAHNVITTELEATKLAYKGSEAESNTQILAWISHVFKPMADEIPRNKDMVESKEMSQGLKSSVRRTNKCSFDDLQGSNHKESKCNGDSIRSQDDQSYPSQLDMLNVNLHRRKPRKVRMLNDIIKSEVLGLSGQEHPSCRNEVVQSRADSTVDPGESKDEKPAADCSLNAMSEEKEKKLFISKKRRELPEGEDEGPSLIDWLRRVPKKVKNQKRDKEYKPASNVIVTSQSMAAATGKFLHPGIGTCGAVQDISGRILEGEMVMNNTQVDAVNPYVKSQQAMINSSHAVVDGETAKCANVRAAPPKLAIKNHTLCSDREHHDHHNDVMMFKNQDTTSKIEHHNDVIMCKKQDTTYKIEHGISFPVYGLKDSFGVSKYESTSAHKASQQISKKRSVRGQNGSAEEAADSATVICEAAAVDSAPSREKQVAMVIREKQADTPVREKMVASPVRETKVCPSVSEKQAVVDGIPVEILELLQSNYHKNHQINTGHFASRVIESSEANKNVRDGGLRRLSNIPGSNLDSTPSSQHMIKSMVYSKSVNTGTTAWPIGKHTGNSNQELGAYTSHYSGKRKRQIKVKGGQGAAALGEPSGAHLRLAPSMNVTQPPSKEPMGSYCPQNYCWNKVMVQNVESHYNAPGIQQHSCRCFPRDAVQINNSHKIYPGIYNSSLIAQTRLLERNQSKITQDSSGLNLIDTSLIRLHKIKQKTDVKNRRTLSAGNYYLEAGKTGKGSGNGYLEAGKTGKGCCSKVTPPLDLHPNDTISAMHLLRLMDPAVGSAASPLCPTVSNEQSDFLKKYKHSENHYQKELFGVDVSMRTKYAFNCLGISDHQICNQTNSSNLLSPVPRYSAFESSSQKRISSDSSNFSAPYEFKGTNQSDVAFSLKTGRKEKRKSSYLPVQPKQSDQRPFLRDRLSQDRLQSIFNSESYPKLSEARENEIHIEGSNKEEVKFPVNICQRELCVVNRNPADFSAPDDNNVYMISYEDLKPRYVSPNRNKQFVIHPDALRQQSVLKLTALKASLRC